MRKLLDKRAGNIGNVVSVLNNNSREEAMNGYRKVNDIPEYERVGVVTESSGWMGGVPRKSEHRVHFS